MRLVNRAILTSTTEDDRFELGLTAILDRFDPGAIAFVHGHERQCGTASEVVGQ